MEFAVLKAESTMKEYVLNFVPLPVSTKEEYVVSFSTVLSFKKVEYC